MRSARLVVSVGLVAAALLVAAGCGGGESEPAATGAGGGPPADAGPAPSGIGTDDETTAECLGCHAPIEPLWQQASAHRLLFDCNGCHALGTEFPHATPVTLPSCGACHSEEAHPSADSSCASCHEPHGSPNAFLVRSSIALPGGGSAEVHFTEAEGASADGLVRAGVEGQTAGTGLCEVCHTATSHYDSAGTASPHLGAWCAECHDHQQGFAKP